MKPYIIIFPLVMMLIFAFYAGKYNAWEKDPTKIKSEGSFIKDWQVSGILALIIMSGIIFRTVKGDYVK